MLGATVQNLDAQTTSRQEFVHPWLWVTVIFFQWLDSPLGA